MENLNQTQRRALEVGTKWAQGPIAGLDDAYTRALVASVVETESSGGDLKARNKEGYFGRYQAGASWLAEAGLIKGGADAVKAAMHENGFGKEWDWAVSGSMTKFLENDSNWNHGLSLAKYAASADLQDKAFKINSDAAYRALVKSRYIIPGTTPQSEIAGLLKARHLSTIESVQKVADGGIGYKDKNGTTTRDYYEHMTKGNGLRYAKYYANGKMLPAERIQQNPQQSSVAPTSAATVAKSAITSAQGVTHRLDPLLQGIQSDTLKHKIASSNVLQSILKETHAAHGNYTSGIFNKAYREGISDEALVKAVYAERKTRYPSLKSRDEKQWNTVQDHLDKESSKRQRQLTEEKARAAGKSRAAAVEVGGNSAGTSTTDTTMVDPRQRRKEMANAFRKNPGKAAQFFPELHQADAAFNAVRNAGGQRRAGVMLEMRRYLAHRIEHGKALPSPQQAVKIVANALGRHGGRGD